MRKIYLILSFVFGTSCFGQNIIEKIIKIDTLEINSFNEKNVLLYEFENATLCISTEKYLAELMEFHNTYSELINDDYSKDKTDDYYNRTFEVIDSIKLVVEKGIESNDTIRLSSKIFERAMLNGLADFRTFINNSECSILDSNGIRQHAIIKKTVIVTNDDIDDYASEWSYFYIFGNDKPFLTALNWIT